jgi:hypothetical protein
MAVANLNHLTGHDRMDPAAKRESHHETPAEKTSSQSCENLSTSVPVDVAHPANATPS